MRCLPVRIAPGGSVVIKSLVGMLVLADPLPPTRLRRRLAPPRTTALRWRAFLAGELYGSVGRFDPPSAHR